jgi:Asp-tRNA(Asn)/Glu-tRNA(Gln) amidotransferase A subunit family amidase
MSNRLRTFRGAVRNGMDAGKLRPDTARALLRLVDRAEATGHTIEDVYFQAIRDGLLAPLRGMGRAAG